MAQDALFESAKTRPRGRGESEEEYEENRACDRRMVDIDLDARDACRLALDDPEGR